MLFNLFCCLINFDYLSVFKWQINCISSLPGTCVKCALGTYFFWNVCHTSVLPSSSFYRTKNHLTGTGKLFRLISNNTNSKLILQSSINENASYIISSAWKISSKINWYLLTSAVPRLRRGDMLQTFVNWEGASSTSSSPQLHAKECKISRFSGANLHLPWTYYL